MRGAEGVVGSANFVTESLAKCPRPVGVVLVVMVLEEAEYVKDVSIMELLGVLEQSD